MLTRNKRWIAFVIVLMQVLTLLPPVTFSSQVLDSGEIAVDSIHFPDEAFRNWILNSKNLNGFGSDGILTAEERDKITEIDVSEQILVI